MSTELRDTARRLIESDDPRDWPLYTLGDLVREQQRARAEAQAERQPDVDLMRAALHNAGIGCKPNVIKCRATHRGHAERIVAAYGAAR